jgi:hypothetical protein
MKSSTMDSDWPQWSAYVAAKNPWFEPSMLRHAINAWAESLQPASLENWLNSCFEKNSGNSSPRRVGLILPGNIPLAGLHDVLCTLIAGHTACVKASSEDAGLIGWAIRGLISLQEEWTGRFEPVDKLNRVDAMIATGSSVTLPYFRQYFGHLPHIFRSHRNSIAILDGQESGDDWIGLGKDIFMYYGKGCRNVSKLLVPHGMTPEHILEGIQNTPWEGQHYRYRNNLDYQLALNMLNRTAFSHNGSIILRQETSPSSPIAVLHYQTYASGEDLARQILLDMPVTQCWSGRELVRRWGNETSFRACFEPAFWATWCYHTVEFGQCQTPEINRYADGVDTMAFLRGLTESARVH